MKTSLGDDCVAINLDYEAVKEVVQIVPDCPNDYENARLRTRERHENFTLRFAGYFRQLGLSKPFVIERHFS